MRTKVNCFRMKRGKTRKDHDDGQRNTVHLPGPIIDFALNTSDNPGPLGHWSLDLGQAALAVSRSGNPSHSSLSSLSYLSYLSYLSSLTCKEVVNANSSCQSDIMSALHHPSPGQSLMLQSFSSVSRSRSSELQAEPPWAAAWMISLVRVCFPSPHSPEHSDQSAHCEISQ